jgi:hypothetical protein
MQQAVQDIHREQAEQVPVPLIDRERRRIGGTGQ